MNYGAISLDEMPTSKIVVDALSNNFSQEDIDLRDIAAIAKEDPIVLANILFLVNKVILKRGAQVVNTLSAAINLVGLGPLRERLLAIKALDSDHNPLAGYELIRMRIYASACLTQYWADYMGQTSAEEMYCASMFTGIGDLAYCLHDYQNNKHSDVDLDSIESIHSLYGSDDNEILLMPDSIQSLFQTKVLPDRLKLSVLVYELVACLEHGYSTEQLNKHLLKLCDYVGIGIHRAGYDFARQLVCLEREANFHCYHHSRYLLSTNTQVLDPIQ